MKKIAITGGLASGKSLTCLFFGALGACVIHADEIVHQLLSNDNNVRKKVLDLLGRDILNLKTGSFDTHKIADIVFRDRFKLEKLEKILHPRVEKELQNWFHCVEHSDVPFIVVEVPLLFETHSEHFYDNTVALLSDDELCFQRFKSRGYNQQQFDMRRQRQCSPLEKACKADFVIENNHGFDDLKKEVTTLFYKMRNFYE